MMDKDIPENLAQELIELDRLGREGVPSIPPREFVGSFVRIQRAMLGWKQDTLASFAEVSLSTVQRIERGERVSAKSLDRVAMALGQKPGAFIEPRVPLTLDELERKLEENNELFKERTCVPVRPLRTQPQVAELAHCDLYLIDSARLSEVCDDEIAALTETLDFVSFVLGTEDEDSMIQIVRREPIRRRELYSMVLNYVRNIEHCGHAVALAGTYQAETDMEILPVVSVALIGFFSKLSDPGAVKRRTLLAPATVDLTNSWESFCKSH